MNEGFDMHNQTFEYKVLESIKHVIGNWNIEDSIENIRRFNVDYVTIKNTSIEHVKEIHGYSLQKLGE